MIFLKSLVFGTISGLVYLRVTGLQGLKDLIIFR